ncbi:MAG: phosphotransferase [Solirubrobacterales bacterium]
MEGAVAATVAVARDLGLEVERPRIISAGANVVVALDPASVIARACGELGPLRPNRGGDHMTRELALAAWIAERGGPIVPPSARIDPGPHLRDGYWLGFWEPADGPSEVDANGAAPALRELHEVIADYDAELPVMSQVIDDVPPMLAAAVAAGGLSAEAGAMVAERLGRLTPSLLDPPLPAQPIHGDAQPHNLMQHGGRLCWIDFEECCIGPVEWDLVCLYRGWQDVPVGDLSAYGASVAVDDDALMPLIEGRMLQGAAYLGLLAATDPSRRPHRDELLARLERMPEL